MNTATRARIRQFGSDAKYAASLERHNAKYGTDDPAEQGRMILEAQRAANRQEATVTDEPLRASKGTIETLLNLCAERTPHVAVTAALRWAEAATAEQVAAKIDWLETQPVAHRPSKLDSLKAAAKADVPAGRYAVRNAEGVVKFYKVDRPTEGKWRGYTFVAAQASDDLHPIRGRNARAEVLAAIAEAGIEASMALYGRELGKCGHCGRTLTDEESRSYGIGPVCRGKMGF